MPSPRLTRRLTAALLAALLLPTGAASAADYRPQPFHARYSVQYNGFKIGEIERTLHVDPNGNYVLENFMYPTGLVALFKQDRVLERSTWRYDGAEAVPLRYYAHDTGRAKDATEQLDFDWPHHRVASLRNGKTTEVPLPPGTLDKLMNQMVLRGDVAAGKKHMEYRVADRGKITPYIYNVAGREKVVTDRGTVEAIKVTKGTTTFWLAPQWDYLLIKLVQKNDDSTFASYIQAPRR